MTTKRVHYYHDDPLLYFPHSADDPLASERFFEVDEATANRWLRVTEEFWAVQREIDDYLGFD